MSSSALPLLKRLRRHRGLWVLVMAVLLIKLVSGSVCAADGGERDGFSGRASVAAAMTMQATPEVPSSDGACLLGEGGSCHCACAHAATLPVSLVLAVGNPGMPLGIPSADAGRVPAVTASLLRPPIA
jgi:hypothetical protein